MAKKTEETKAPEICIDIIHGKRPVSYRAWRYYGIVDALRSAGVDQETSYALGKWARTAKDGETVTACNGTDQGVTLKAVLR